MKLKQLTGSKLVLNLGIEFTFDGSQLDKTHILIHCNVDFIRLMTKSINVNFHYP